MRLRVESKDPFAKNFTKKAFSQSIKHVSQILASS